MDEQRKVAEFVDEHGLDMSTEFRLLNLVEEIGEIAEDAIESAEYGDSPGDIEVTSDELGACSSPPSRSGTRRISTRATLLRTVWRSTNSGSRSRGTRRHSTVAGGGVA